MNVINKQDMAEIEWYYFTLPMWSVTHRVGIIGGSTPTWSYIMAQLVAEFIFMHGKGRHIHKPLKQNGFKQSLQ